MCVRFDGLPYPERPCGSASEQTRNGTKPKPRPSRGSAEPEELTDPVASFAIRSLSRWQRDVLRGSPYGSSVPETTPRRVFRIISEKINRASRSRAGTVSWNAKGDAVGREHPSGITIAKRAPPNQEGRPWRKRSVSQSGHSEPFLGDRGLQIIETVFPTFKTLITPSPFPT